MNYNYVKNYCKYKYEKKAMKKLLKFAIQKE